ncbi:MAG: 2-hydroxyacid dehydrogenase [Burkholderiaceae bacterium]
MATEILMLNPLYEPTQAALEAGHTCHKLWEAADPAARLRELAHIEVCTSQSGAGIDAATMDALPNLKLVSNFGVGLDTYDLKDCTRRGVTVTNTPDVLTLDVADMALALLLGVVRQVPYGDRFVREGRWRAGNMRLTQTMQDKKIGIVGMGRIGQAIASRCLAFQTEIAYFGPRRKTDLDYRYFDDIVALGRWADVLIAACPGGPATYRVVSRDALAALGPEGIFVNIARGSVVDQDALIELLSTSQLAGAGLDVFDNEPDVPDSLKAMEQVVLAPHQGSASVRTRLAMGQLVIDNIAAWFAGKPLVTPAN